MSEECPTGTCGIPGARTDRGNIEGREERLRECNVYCDRHTYCEGLLRGFLKSHGGSAITPCGKTLILEVKDAERKE